MTRSLFVWFLMLLAVSLSATDARAEVCTDNRIVAANRLLKAKLFDQAQAQATLLLADPTTAPCAATVISNVAKERASSNESSLTSKLMKSVSKAFDWLLVPVAAALLVIIVLLASRLFSAARRKWLAPRWRVRSIAKDADPQIIASWRAAFLDPEQRGRARLALLIGAGIRLPRGLLSGTSGDAAQIDLLTDAPEVQGLKLSWLGAIWQAATRAASSPRRTIAVWATVRGQSAMMRVEAIDARRNLKTTSLSSGWASDDLAAQEIEKMAAAMALRTSYLLADESSTRNPTARGYLHVGLERLGAYASGGDVSALGQAIEAFGQTRRLDPTDADALLYEGIARELLEEPDLAQTLFLQAEAGQNQATAALARFNRAISNLRRYTPEKIESAVTQLEHIRKDKASPELRAFATAAKAGAIAHKFLFWPEFEPKGDWEIAKWEEPERAQKKAQLHAWTEEINRLLKSAETALKAAPFNNDIEASLQLRWMIKNAGGNRDLNCSAKAAAAYGLSAAERKQSLEDALQAFRECEVLLPPGVETLTNIATTLLELGRFEEAIQYARRARKLNPSYEYAYYREAQAEERRGQAEAAKAILESAQSKLALIKIPGFLSLFGKLGVNPDGA